MASLLDRHPLPEADLRAAFERSRKDNWPATFEEAMADPTLSRLITLNALHPPRSKRPAAPRLFTPLRRVDPSPGQVQLPGIAPGVRIFDRKRAAAGERDDD